MNEPLGLINPLFKSAAMPHHSRHYFLGNKLACARKTRGSNAIIAV